MKILVVDDDPVILDMLSLVLRQEGHQDIHCAASGASALEAIIFAEEEFDILILDIQMPEMDGITLCRSIRQIPLYHSTPIIMLTTSSDTRSIEGAFSVGANDYITKPFDIKGIGQRIRIAERMMGDSCQIVKLHDPIEASLDLKDTQIFDVNEPIRILGLDQHTDSFSLGNYLSQLTREKLCEVSVFALKINYLNVLNEELSDNDMLQVLAQVSNSISTAANDNRLLNAYTGSGIFICIASNEILDVWEDMEQRIEQLLQHFQKANLTHISSDIEVTIGRPFCPNANKGQRVKAAFERAISQLNRRVEAIRMTN